MATIQRWYDGSGNEVMALESYAGGYRLTGNVIQPGSLNTSLTNSSGGIEITSGGILQVVDGGITPPRMSPKTGQPLVGDLNVTGTGGGGVLALANPFGVDVYVTRIVVVITGASSVASTSDVGIAADATTSADNLIDGLNTGAAGAYDNIDDQGSNGSSTRKWGSSQYLTISQASGTVTGATGRYWIHCVDAS